MCGGKIVINKRIVHHSRDSAPTSQREANVKTIHNHLTQSGEVLVHSAAVINREINLATCPGEEAGAARFLIILRSWKNRSQTNGLISFDYSRSRRVQTDGKQT